MSSLQNGPIMKKVIVLGSTGSLGIQTLEVLARYPQHFEVIGLSAGTNEELLRKQAKSLIDGTKTGVSRHAARHATAKQGPFYALGTLPNLDEADIVINVISGLAGIEATLKTLELGKILLLGNKESLVAEGEKLKSKIVFDGIIPKNIIPLDSEHNAIYEILKSVRADEQEIKSQPSQPPGKNQLISKRIFRKNQTFPRGNSGKPQAHIKSLILPCSGGPFLNRTDLENITPEEAIAHPKWKMGPKISLESATLINKGLEVLEAHYLFDIPLEKIQVKIHPECVIHGAVQFEGLGPQPIAYLGKPDMREHIENALLRAINLEPPKREIRELKPGEFTLTDPPSHLPGIQLVLNAKDKKKFLEKEEAVLKKFLNHEMSFSEIYKELDKA